MHSLNSFLKSDKKTTISPTIGIILIVIAVFCIIFSIIMAFLYLNRVKRKKVQNNQEFLIQNQKYKTFEFWINYAYLFGVIVPIVAFLVLFLIGINAVIV